MVILLIILAVILLLAGICAFTSYNSFVKARNKVEEAFSTMDVYLKKRWDLIPNLVETVKGYASHEKSTLEGVIRLRNTAYGNLSDEQKIEKNRDLSRGIVKIMALAENYPDLKANTEFINLSNQLGSIEDDIASARKYYNGAVRQYNNKIQTFPGNIFAKMFGFQSRKMFEIESAERENVKVQF